MEIPKLKARFPNGVKISISAAKITVLISEAVSKSLEIVNHLFACPAVQVIKILT